MKGSIQWGVSVLTAMVVSLTTTLIMYLADLLHWARFDQSLYFILPPLVFLSCYLIVYVTVREFIFIKLLRIYELIDGFRQDKSDIEDKNIFDAVQTRVIEFSLQKSKEIEQLKKLEQYRKEFLGNVSHELKTPIFNIQGYLETLLDGGMEDGKIARDFLTRASRNTERLSEIVSDLLLISQYESGDLTLHMSTYDIVDQVREVYESFMIQARSKNIDLRFRDMTMAPVFVTADKLRIGQVFYNLVANAIKYCNEGCFVSASFTDQGDKILIEIRDNGPGIAQEHLSRLFERFYRVDRARSRDKGGTGLGLAIAKHIVEAHKQSITVTSAVGLGTTFSFSLQRPVAG
ncbi:MAG: sensor histidine kinase [Bacteroidetes bacterium]|nr:sensor histidine kinase [Bacteroidota bacterium]